jgi:hypothetical protein
MFLIARTSRLRHRHMRLKAQTSSLRHPLIDLMSDRSDLQSEIINHNPLSVCEACVLFYK